MLGDFRTHALLERGVTFIVEIHDQRYSGVEVPTRFEILCYTAQRLVRSAQQRFLLLGDTRDGEGTLYPTQCHGVAIDEAVDLVQKAPGALDAFFAPFEVPLGLGG